jgi:hypothetical protein
MYKKAFFCLLFSGLLYAQSQNRFYIERDYLLNRDSSELSMEKTLFLKIYNVNYFKNNEYFSPVDIGLTNLASIIQPTLGYFFTATTQMEAGFLADFYYANNTLSRSFILPIFRFNWQFHPAFMLTMGSLYGHLAHGFIEPLFEFDRAINTPVEYGIQLQHRGFFVETQLYLNWMNYIFKDTFNQKETFAAGHALNLKPMAKTRSQFKLEIPFFVYFYHRGGQSDTLQNQPLITISNTDLGLRLYYEPKLPQFVQRIQLQNNYILYHALAGSVTQAFSKGWGNYTTLQFQSKWFNVLAGYWRAHQFIAPQGEHLFQSVGYIPKDEVKPSFANREMITAKFDFYYKIVGDLYFLINLGGYYHLDFKEFDYYYGCTLAINQLFRLKKF